MKYFDYSIIRYVPDSRRGEVVNIGVLVYHHQRVETYMLANLAKARQLDASLSIKDLDDLPVLLNDMAASANNVEQMHMLMADLGAIKLSSPAYFTAGSESEYADRIKEIMHDLITPRCKQKIPRPRGRLITELKRQFQNSHLLAEPGEDISKNHKVVVGYTIANESDLAVDFAQKNGRWHITQAIDYKIKKDKLPTKIKEVGIKSVGLDQAKKYLGKDTFRFCIIDVPEDYQSSIQGQINILSQYADHVLYYGSQEDMVFYWENVFKAANINELM